MHSNITRSDFWKNVVEVKLHSNGEEITVEKNTVWQEIKFDGKLNVTLVSLSSGQVITLNWLSLAVCFKPIEKPNGGNYNE